MRSARTSRVRKQRVGLETVEGYPTLHFDLDIAYAWARRRTSSCTRNSRHGRNHWTRLRARTSECPVECHNAGFVPNNRSATVVRWYHPKLPFSATSRAYYSNQLRSPPTDWWQRSREEYIFVRLFSFLPKGEEAVTRIVTSGCGEV